MKIKFLLGILLIFSLAACKGKKADQEKPVLMVSIEPQKYFLEQLVGDKYTVNCAIPAGSNPETFDPSPSQLINISKSKAYFAIGTLSSEHLFLEKVKTYDTGIKIIDCSEHIALLENDHHHHCEFHSAHEHGDPHIWSTPASARIIVQNMYHALTALEEDGANKEYYLANYTQLLSRINQTDEEIKNYLSKASNKSFIIYHPALSYFAEEYGLHQLTIEHDGKSPSPTYLAKLINEARKENIKAVFIQQEFDAKNAETLAKEIGAKAHTINLLSYDWNEEMIKIAKALSDE